MGRVGIFLGYKTGANAEMMQRSLLLLLVVVPAGCWGIVGLDSVRSTVVISLFWATAYMTA